MSRHRENNIFYRVLGNEDSVTEMFCNLLMFKPFREQFLSRILEKIKKIHTQDKALNNLTGLTYDDIDTQIAIEEGRPDIVILNEKIKIFIEVKITKYRELTDNQPEGYLADLGNKENANKTVALFFLIPQGYYHIEEIKKRWQEWTKGNKGKENQPQWLLWSNNIEEDSFFIYWEDIRDIIRDSQLDALNPIFQQFTVFLDVMLSSVFLLKADADVLNELITGDYLNNSYRETDNFFTKEEASIMSTSVPLAMNKLFRIVENIREKIQGDGKLKEDWYVQSIKGDSAQYGFSITCGDANIFCGVWFASWHKFNAPLCILAPKDVYDTATEEFKRYFEPTPFISDIINDDDNPYYVHSIKTDELRSEKDISEIGDKLVKLIDIYKIKK